MLGKSPTPALIRSNKGMQYSSLSTFPSYEDAAEWASADSRGQGLHLGPLVLHHCKINILFFVNVQVCQVWQCLRTVTARIACAMKLNLTSGETQPTPTPCCLPHIKFNVNLKSSICGTTSVQSHILTTAGPRGQLKNLD